MELRVSNLNKDYISEGKRITALADLDLIIPANQIFTLLGPSGKTAYYGGVTPALVPEPGGLVTFTVTITNESEPGDPVTITSLVDDIHGDLDGQGTLFGAPDATTG